MKKFVPAVALALMLPAGFAMAGSCPSIVAEIDEMLETAELNKEDMAIIMSKRDEGEMLHESGNHDGSVAVLTEAIEMIEDSSD